ITRASFFTVKSPSNHLPPDAALHETRAMRTMLVLLCLLGVPDLLLAQSNVADAAIKGYVTDANGAPVPGATVVVTAPATSQGREVTTASDGYFLVTLLRVGDYRLTVSAPGFADYRREGITLDVGSSVRVDVKLALTGVDEHVTVHADASMVQTAATGAG